MRKVLTLLLAAILLSSCEAADDASPTAGGGPQVGIGGSLAAFTIVGDYLYAVENQSLRTFSLENPEPGPVLVQPSVFVPGVAQTVFGYGQYLFIGSTTDMYIYSLSSPAEPSLVATHSRLVTACDPVVVRNDIAYTTINVQSCRDAVGQEVLDVLDVREPEEPVLVSSIAVDNPFGLGVNDDYLFLCRGERGLNVYSLADPFQPTFLYTHANINAWDVIPINNSLLLLTGDNGLFLLDVTDPASPEVLGSLPTGS